MENILSTSHIISRNKEEHFILSKKSIYLDGFTTDWNK